MVNLRRKFFVLGGIASLFVLGFGLAFFAPVCILPLREGFAREENYALSDSLPAIGSEIQALEAFRVFEQTAEMANKSNSVSYSSSPVRKIVAEYNKVRPKNDSITVLSWSAEGKVEKSVLVDSAAQAFRKVYTDSSNFSGKIRHVCFISYPRAFYFERKAGVQPFEPIEGASVTMLSAIYPYRKFRYHSPDTMYSAMDFADFQLLVKGNSLAAVNGGNKSIKFALYGTAIGWQFFVAKEKVVSIFRGVLNSDSFYVAYTSPNSRTLPFQILQSPTQKYFYLERQ